MYFGVYHFLVIFFPKNSLECQTDWIKIRSIVRQSYLQSISADDTKIVCKELTNMSIVSFLWGIDKPVATERVVSNTRVQTV